MKSLVVVLCLAAIVSSAQAKSLNCRRVVVASGHHVYMADDMFGLRTIHVRGLQSLAEGAYSSARDSAGGATVPRGHAYLAEAGGALVGGVLVGAGAAAGFGFIGALWGSAASHGDDEGFYAGAVLGVATGAALTYPLGCGMGTATVGRWMKRAGNTRRAYAGAYVGMALGGLAGLATGSWEVAVPTMVLLSSAGAVIGYNTGDALGLRTTEVRGLQSPADVAHSYAQDSARRAVALGRRRAHAAEAGGALVGGVIVGAGAGFALGMAGMWIDAETSPSNQLSGLYGLIIGGASGIALGYPCGCAMGAATVGKWTGHAGSTGRAYAGAYLGMPVGICFAWVGARSPGAGALLIPAGVLAPLVGAVVGYNKGMSSLSARLAPPTLAYRTRLGPERQRYATFDCRLVTVRF